MFKESTSVNCHLVAPLLLSKFKILHRPTKSFKKILSINQWTFIFNDSTSDLVSKPRARTKYQFEFHHLFPVWQIYTHTWLISCPLSLTALSKLCNKLKECRPQVNYPDQACNYKCLQCVALVSLSLTDNLNDWLTDWLKCFAKKDSLLQRR